MTYTETLATLAADTQAQVLAAFASWQEGLLTQSDFLAVASAYLAAAGNRAVALADLALAAYLSVHYGRAVPTLGMMPPVVDHRPALATIAASTGVDLADAFAVHSRAVTLDAAQTSYQRAMRGHGVEQWTRVLNAGGCPLCQDLTGVDLPTSVDMYTHKGCGCTQQPILNERTPA